MSAKKQNQLKRTWIYASVILILCGITPSSQGQVEVEKPTRYALIVTGGELLRGVYADGHTHFITKTLAPLGCQCQASITVGDTRDQLFEALQFAEKQADLILVTGGLGPTDDDITRQVLSEFSGIEIKEHPEVIKSMKRRFQRDTLQANLLRQTMVPVEGRYLANPNGSAVGLVFEGEEQVLVALPGPPNELQPMIINEFIPYLSEKYGIHSIGCSITMRFVGVGESTIDKVMHDHLQLPEDLMISSLFDKNRVDLTFSLPEDSPENRQALKQLEEDLLEHLGEYMYSDSEESLEKVIIQTLIERKEALVTTEVGSGGGIAAALNNVENVKRSFSGGYIAPNHYELFEMLGENIEDTSLELPKEIIERSAQIAQRLSDSDWGIAVSEVFYEGESSHVYVTVSSPKEELHTKKMTLRGHGKETQDRLVTQALDFFRRMLK